MLAASQCAITQPELIWIAIWHQGRTMEPRPPKVKKKKDMPADLFSQLYFQFVTPKGFNGAGGGGKRLGLLLLQIEGISRIRAVCGESLAEAITEALKAELVQTFDRFFPHCNLVSVKDIWFQELLCCFQCAAGTSGPVGQAAYFFSLGLSQRLRRQFNDLPDPSLQVRVGHAAWSPNGEQPGQEAFAEAVHTAQASAAHPDAEIRFQVGREFDQIIEKRLLHVSYQAILDFNSQQLLGREAFVRGPEKSFFQWPAILYSHAEATGQTVALEKKRCKEALGNYAPRSGEETLFLNVDPRALAEPGFSAYLSRLIREKGLGMNQLVLELDEACCAAHKAAVFSVLAAYQGLGVSVSVDNAGKGGLDLGFLARIRPDYLKLSPTLLAEVGRDPVSRTLAESLVGLCRTIGTRILGEGVGDPEELSRLLSLGVGAGQGEGLAGLLARTPYQPGQAEPEKENRLRESELKYSAPIHLLARSCITVSPETTVQELKKVIAEMMPMTGVVIAKDHQPLGLLMKYNLDRQLGTRYGVSLFYHRTVSRVMDTEPLVVQAGLALEEVAKMAMQRSPKTIYDDVIICQNQKLLGTVSVQRILETLSRVAEKERDAAKADNEKIKSSIRYARMIQTSLLPDFKRFQQFVPHSFFIWRPKDMVGGDIFFVDRFDAGEIIAVMDCTGHGVPAAFMTMIVSVGFRRIVNEEGCTDPGRILEKLNRMVKNTLHQNSDKAVSDDGLDAAICFVPPSDPGQGRRLIFAGARLPLLYVRDGRIQMIKGDRQSLGYVDSDPEHLFETHVLELQPGMRFYLFTDGFPDQLGGPRRLPFGKKRFKQLILENCEQPFPVQREKLLIAFEQHRGDNERQDDITVVGFALEREK